MHGSLLPKNPAFADHLIRLALTAGVVARSRCRRWMIVSRMPPAPPSSAGLCPAGSGSDSSRLVDSTPTKPAMPRMPLTPNCDLGTLVQGATVTGVRRGSWTVATSRIDAAIDKIAATQNIE